MMTEPPGYFSALKKMFTLHYYKISHKEFSVMLIHFLQAMYLSVTFSQLITFQIAFRYFYTENNKHAPTHRFPKVE